MDAIAFGAEVVAVSASGVLAPGPLFVANMVYGTTTGRGALSGVRVTHGHAIVEAILIAAIAAGLFSAHAFIAGYAAMIAAIGGASIIGFAVMQIMTSGIAGKRRTKNGQQEKKPLPGRGRLPPALCFPP